MAPRGLALHIENDGLRVARDFAGLAPTQPTASIVLDRSDCLQDSFPPPLLPGGVFKANRLGVEEFAGFFAVEQTEQTQKSAAIQRTRKRYAGEQGQFATTSRSRERGRVARLSLKHSIM